MIGSLVRGVVAVVVGFLVALFFIVAVEIVTLALYPFPDGVDPLDPEVCRAHVASLPTGALLIGVVGWGLAVFSGVWVATRLAAGRHPAPGIVLGVLLLASAVMNMSMLPYPGWFWAANLIAFPVLTFLGVSLGRG